MFLDVDGCNYIAVYGRVRELSESIKYILICVLKMNKAFTGLERHGDAWLMTIFILVWSNPLILGIIHDFALYKYNEMLIMLILFHLLHDYAQMKMNRV